MTAVMRRLPVFAAVLIFALTLFWACNDSSSGENHFNVIGDTTWIECDNVMVELVDKDGKTVDTLFNGVLHSLSQLKNLSAAKYDGTKAALVITGTKGDGVCFEEKRSFEGNGESLVIDTVRNGNAPVQSVTTDPESLSIALGSEAAAVKASVKPAYADQAVTWSISGDGVVALGIPTGGDGTEIRIIPTKAGITTVTVKSAKDPGKTAHIRVNVTGPAWETIGLDQDSLILYTGGAGERLHAAISPLAAGQQVEWKSLDPSVAIVDSTGMVTPVGVGDIFVVAKSAASGNQASARVVVIRDAPVLTVASKTGAPVNTSITFSPKSEQKYGIIAMYKWDVDGDGAWDDSIADPGVELSLDLPPRTASYSQEGAYTASFLVRDGEGNEVVEAVSLSIGNQAPEILAIRADTIISIRDSISMDASLRDVDGKVAWCGWDYDGDGYFDDSLAFLDSAVEAAFGHRFPDAGFYRPVFKAKDESGKTRLDTVKVKVEMDPPLADIGNDTTVIVGTAVLVHAKATDKLGGIVKRELLIPGAGPGFIPLSGADTAITAPGAPTASFVIVLRVTDDDGLTESDSLNVNVILSASADLAKLIYSAGPIDPVFKPEISNYSAHAGYGDSLVTVTPSVNDPAARILVNSLPVPSGNTSDPVKIGLGANVNAFRIEVTSEDGAQRIYSLSITRDPSADASLSKLDVTGFTLRPAFKPLVLDYADTVASTVTAITLKPTLAVAVSALTVNDSALASGIATKPLPLAIGANLFRISVTSQSGLIKTVYRIKVVRRARLVVLRSLDGKTATRTDSLEADPGQPYRILSAPVTGYHFLKWTLLEGTAAFSDSAANPADLTLKSVSVRAQAEFAINKYTIKAAAIGGGSITPSGGIIVDHGHGQAFTIAAAVGNRFKSLTVDSADATAEAAGGTYNFTSVTSDHAITAAFVKSDTITAKAGAGGSIAPLKTIVDEGSDTAITVTPLAGFRLATFTVDGVDALGKIAGGKYAFKAIKGSHSVEATFIQVFTLSGSAGPGGTITPVSASVDKGASHTFTVTANADYRVLGFQDNAKNAIAGLAGGKYTLTAIDTAHTVAVTFLRQFPITVSVSGNGTGQVTPSGTVVVDSLAASEFKFAAGVGSRLTSVLVDNVTLSNPGALTSYIFPSVISKHTLSLVFTKVSYPVTATVALGAGTFTPASVSIDSLGSQVFTMTPAANYRLYQVTEGRTVLVSDTAATKYTLSGVATKHDLQAWFWRKYTITATASTSGTITIPNPVIDSTGAETIVFKPKAGFRVDRVLDNGAQVAATGAYYGDQSLTLKPILANHVLSATYKRYYTLAGSSNDATMGTITPATTNVDEGGKVDFLITPAIGYRLASLTDNDVSVSPVGSFYTVAGVAANHKVVAVFAKIPTATLTVTDSAAGLGEGYEASPEICITIVKSEETLCGEGRISLELETGTEFTVSTDPSIVYSNCLLGLICDNVDANFAAWVQTNPKGGPEIPSVNPMEKPIPLNESMTIKAVYSKGLRTGL
ncbi:MAG: cadherin-like beta sandwich domain-containing protein [Fibrobacteria bacterium]